MDLYAVDSTPEFYPRLRLVNWRSHQISGMERFGMSTTQYPVTDEMKAFFLRELDKVGAGDVAHLLMRLRTKFECETTLAAFTLVELTANKIVRVDIDDKNRSIVKRGSMTQAEIQAILDRKKVTS